MSFLSVIADALRGRPTASPVRPAPTPRPAPAPTPVRRPTPSAPRQGPARICEQVDPDGGLVHQRGAAIRVYAIEGNGRLPDDTIAYKSRGTPSMLFRFTIVRCSNGEYRAYIRNHPRYGTRATDAHSTHRLHDRHGHYVCWAPMPRSARDLLKVTRLWADHTARYISTGRAIGAP